jgi:hypothetical protein
VGAGFRVRVGTLGKVWVGEGVWVGVNEMVLVRVVVGAVEGVQVGDGVGGGVGGTEDGQVNGATVGQVKITGVGEAPCEVDCWRVGVEADGGVAEDRWMRPSAWESERTPKSKMLETSIRTIPQTTCRVFRILVRFGSHPFNNFFRPEEDRQEDAECGPAACFSLHPNAPPLGFNE